MLDIRRVRTDFDGVLAGLGRRGDSSIEAELRRAIVSDERLLLDPERASKLSGSMFVLYRGMGARLLRAMTQLALDRHTTGEGAYEEVRPPSLVRTETMTATGQLPKFADDAYNLERDDL